MKNYESPTIEQAGGDGNEVQPQVIMWYANELLQLFTLNFTYARFIVYAVKY